MSRALTVGTCASLLIVACSIWFLNKYFGIEAHALARRVWPAPTIENVEKGKLRNIAGWFSLNCGHVGHRGDGDAAMSCATNALKTRKRFYVSFDYVGLDSGGAIGLAANRKGEVFQVMTTQLTYAPPDAIVASDPVRTVTVTRCEKPPVKTPSHAENQYLWCPDPNDW